MMFATLYFVGNLNDSVLLAGVGMGNMLINIMGLSSLYGMNGALETLVSQSYGAKEYEMCSVYTNRGKFICVCFMVPISVLFYFG